MKAMWNISIKIRTKIADKLYWLCWTSGADSVCVCYFRRWNVFNFGSLSRKVLPVIFLIRNIFEFVLIQLNQLKGRLPADVPRERLVSLFPFLSVFFVCLFPSLFPFLPTIPYPLSTPDALDTHLFLVVYCRSVISNSLMMACSPFKGA